MKLLSQWAENIVEKKENSGFIKTFPANMDCVAIRAKKFLQIFDESVLSFTVFRFLLS